MATSNSSIPETRQQLLSAIGLLIAALICLDGMSVFVRLLSDRYSPMELSAYRNILGMLPSLIVLLATGELKPGRQMIIRQCPLALSRGLIVAVAQLLYYSAITHQELATVGALMQTNALFTVIFAMLFLREGVGPWRWGAVGLGFVGALLILRPGSEAFSTYALLAIISAACYALAMVLVRRIDAHVPSPLLYLYSAFGAAFGAVVMASTHSGFAPIHSATDAGLIFAMAMCGGVGVLLLMLAYRRAAPSALAPFSYFSLLTAFAAGYLFFGEAPLDTLFPGALLILAAGGLIIWRENR